MCHTSIHASSTGNEDEENMGEKGISRSMRVRKRVQTCSQTPALPKESELEHNFVGVVFYS